MEALRIRLVSEMVIVLTAVSVVQNATAGGVPLPITKSPRAAPPSNASTAEAPSPTSDATAFMPSVFASFIAFAFMVHPSY
ncbi:hypothetical protein Godav_001504 [Gossypium davidsonii]|uniref:Uncharacterized protein n=2 Tax=Gossypium TaxID=3633 RepID=A0A0D2W7I2_GOSRA|nr:hypothetical protein B456_013G193100 [Gossypium raimondii]MBA0632828.1 hypothetical protein [Gossypium davidsonii]